MVFFIDITWLLTKKCIMKVKTIALNIFARNKNEWNRSNNLQLDYFVESYHIPDYWWKVSCFKNHCIFLTLSNKVGIGFFPGFSGVSLTLTDIIKDNISASSKSDGIEISFDLEEVGTCWNICLIQNSLQFFLWEMTNKKPGICCSILFLRYWFSCPNLSLHIKKLWETGMCCMLSSKYITYIIIFRISPKCKTLKGFLGH